MIYVIMYLSAIVIANLLTAWLGPWMSVINAFLFIGLDLTARDKLHDAWENQGLIWKMALLIGAGSLISWFLNRNAGQIAIASFVAFCLAGIADTIIYTILKGKTKLFRINGSNVVAAAVDSFTFPAIAFGFPLLWLVMLGQFAAKVGGGFIWSLILQVKLRQIEWV